MTTSKNDDAETPYEPNIVRHAERTTPFTPPEHSGLHLAALEAHIAKHIGPVENVFHEIVSDLVHIDVLVVPATQERPFHVLVTSGMSDLPMSVPEGFEGAARAEIAIALPGYWSLAQADFADESVYWPIRWLKMIARLPHEHATWVGYGHTIPNGDPPGRIANTRFVGVAVSLPLFAPPEFCCLETPAGDSIVMLTLVPLHRDEMELKLAKGWDHVFGLLIDQQQGMFVESQRPSVARRRRWWWPFG